MIHAVHDYCKQKTVTLFTQVPEPYYSGFVLSGRAAGQRYDRRDRASVCYVCKRRGTASCVEEKMNRLKERRRERKKEKEEDENTVVRFRSQR